MEFSSPVPPVHVPEFLSTYKGAPKVLGSRSAHRGLGRQTVTRLCSGSGGLSAQRPWQHDGPRYTSRLMVTSQGCAVLRFSTASEHDSNRAAGSALLPRRHSLVGLFCPIFGGGVPSSDGRPGLIARQLFRSAKKHHRICFGLAIHTLTFRSHSSLVAQPSRLHSHRIFRKRAKMGGKR